MSYLPSGFLPKSNKMKYVSQLNFYNNEPLLYQILEIRKKKNMDSINCVVGGKRTGKSYFCLKTCEILSRKWGLKPFTVDNVFFEIEDLFEFMNNNTDSMCIMEESGLLLNAQDWNTIESKLTRNMVMTQGFRRNIIFLNLPHFAFLNKSLRLMTNFVIETLDIGKVVVKKVTVKHSEGEGYFTNVEYINFDMPEKQLVDDYENKKKKYNDIWLSQDLDFLQLLSGKKKLEKEVKIKPLPIEKIIDLFKKDKVDYEFAMKELNLHGFDFSRADMLLNP